MFPSMLEHALLQMFWQVIWNNEDTFDNALGPSVRSCKSGEQRPFVWEPSPTCVAMTMAVVLRLLYSIDLVCHNLNILGLVWWNLFDALVLPVNIFPIGHGGLVLVCV